MEKGTDDKDKIYEKEMNLRLAKYGMCLIKGQLTTVDINLKPNA